MRLDDPARPEWMNGQKMYLDAKGTPVAPIPTIHMRFHQGILSLSIYCKYAWNEFGEKFWKPANGFHLEQFLVDWQENPEAAMLQYFGYSPPASHAAKQRNRGSNPPATSSLPEATLDDLDDLLGR